MIDTLLKDKSKKIKEKVATISNWLLSSELPIDELLAFAEQAKDADKASCIEAIEYATKQNAKIADESVLNFVTKMLKDNSPRVKWESAKVIGNIAHLYPSKLTKPIAGLMTITKDEGTVVRWATAFALGEILKLKTKHNKELMPALEALCEKEKENGVKKKYLDALKKTKK